MKNKGLIALLLTIVMSMSLLATACSSTPKTLEEYINSNQEEMEQVQAVADESKMQIEFNENDVIYSYDISSMENLTEEVAKSDIMKDNLSSSLESLSDRFVGLCGQLEEKSQIEGVQIIVNFTYGDEILVSKTFNSQGMVG